MKQIITNIFIDIKQVILNLPLLFKRPSRASTREREEIIDRFIESKIIENKWRKQKFWQILLPTRKSLSTGSSEFNIKYGEVAVHKCDYLTTPPTVLYVNGMLTTENKAIQDAQYLSAVLRKDVRGIYNPTRGFIVDIFESIFGRTFNMRTSIAKDTFTSIERAIDLLPKGERLLLVGHSQGGIIISTAIGMMVRKYGVEGTYKRLSAVDILTLGSGDNGNIFKVLKISHNNLQNRVNILQVRNKYDFVANLSSIKMVNSESQYVIDAKGHNLVPHYLANLILKSATSGVPKMIDRYIKFRRTK